MQNIDCKTVTVVTELNESLGLALVEPHKCGHNRFLIISLLLPLVAMQDFKQFLTL